MATTPTLKNGLAIPIESDGARAMALDAEMLRAASGGVISWRLYTWDSVWVTLGANQVPSEALVSPSSTNWALRPTGGSAVLHGHDLTFSFAAQIPAELRRRVRSVFEAMVFPLVQAFSASGVTVMAPYGVTARACHPWLCLSGRPARSLPEDQGLEDSPLSPGPLAHASRLDPERESAVWSPEAGTEKISCISLPIGREYSTKSREGGCLDYTPTESTLLRPDEIGTPPPVGRRKPDPAHDCFATAGAYDIVGLDGLKLCGCAMKVTAGAALVQASIPIRHPDVDPATIIKGAFLHPIRAFDFELFAKALIEDLGEDRRL